MGGKQREVDKKIIKLVKLRKHIHIYYDVMLRLVPPLSRQCLKNLAESGERSEIK